MRRRSMTFIIKEVRDLHLHEGHVMREGPQREASELPRPPYNLAILGEGGDHAHLPGMAVAPVAVHLPLADGAHQQALPPPQLLALLDDGVPQPAGLRGAAQAVSVQLAEDPHAHLQRKRLHKVQRGAFGGGCHQGGASFHRVWGRSLCRFILHHKGGGGGGD